MHSLVLQMLTRNTEGYADQWLESRHSRYSAQCWRQPRSCFRIRSTGTIIADAISRLPDITSAPMLSVFRNRLKTSPFVPSARQHQSYGDCLEVKREYRQNCSVIGCVTQCLQSAAHSCELFSHVQHIGFVTLGPLRRA